MPTESKITVDFANLGEDLAAGAANVAGLGTDTICRTGCSTLPEEKAIIACSSVSISGCHSSTCAISASEMYGNPGAVPGEVCGLIGYSSVVALLIHPQDHLCERGNNAQQV